MPGMYTGILPKMKEGCIMNPDELLEDFIDTAFIDSCINKLSEGDVLNTDEIQRLNEIGIYLQDEGYV
jgi:hypothetical protein